MVVHPQVVMDAHHAGCAAAKQGKFAEFKNAFWEKAFGPYAAQHDQSKLGVDNIMAIAKDLGLDTARLKSDMDGADCKAQVENDMTELAKFKNAFWQKAFGRCAAQHDQSKLGVDNIMAIAKDLGLDTELGLVVLR